MELQEEFRKIKPHTFDGAREEGAKPWLLNMIKHFQVYDYESYLKACLTIYQLQGKTTLSWDEVKFSNYSKIRYNK